MSEDLSASAQSSLAVLSAARIALGLTGPSIPTREQLRFQLDHALARDAVHAAMDAGGLLQQLQQRGLEGMQLRSAACQDAWPRDRSVYLRRPDLGRSLHESSRRELEVTAENRVERRIVFAIVDGLSALAVERHALPLLDATLPLLQPEDVGEPICLVRQGRVAVGDEIGELLRAELMVLLIGERPGLSASDSLGVYLTWQPRRGRTDAERNCISNVRLEGLSYEIAAQRIAFYVREARWLQTTGIALKETAADPATLALE
ncbi:ethanolamine ammonia-lyase subunit EutC [Terriglobus roseus]|uniref:Ethanolamine ammonia-lyase small subunit n=1 Tax=Terriglobus roseus TaxID=392734 RepID=A0A1H4SME9_9BACT|nr:ethanolamine ammonia-lyase subunit EutC [Terriglobus roseus]SEC45247.1 Ethanolamine ammonia-lyase light chain [Terriglobus roseus]